MKSLLTFGAICIASTSPHFTNAGNGIKDKLDRVGLNTVTTAVPFLNISPDARSSGMGDAGVALSPDANAMHWNPAKLVFIDSDVNSGISFSYTPWLKKLVPDISMTYLSYYKLIKKNQAIGASMRYFALGDIAFTGPSGAVMGNYSPNEYAIDLAYSRQISNCVSVGLTGRYIYSNLTGGIPVSGIGTKPGRSASVDASWYFHNPDVILFKKDTKFSMGANVSNIGGKISYSESGETSFIPINIKLGSALEIKLDDYNTISFVGDFNKLLVPTPPVRDKNGTIVLGKNPNRSVVSGMFGSFSDAPGGFGEEVREVNSSFGMEYWYDNQFAFRTGYFYEHPYKGNRQYFTFGAGVKWSTFTLDMAYLVATDQRNPLENTLRFSLLFDFANLKGLVGDQAKS